MNLESKTLKNVEIIFISSLKNKLLKKQQCDTIELSTKIVQFLRIKPWVSIKLKVTIKCRMK
jgi:hypothetical protein